MTGSIGSGAARAGRTTFSALRTALTFRALFLTGLALAVSYATVLLAVICMYRKGYGGPGKPELLALRFAAKGLGRSRADRQPGGVAT